MRFAIALAMFASVAIAAEPVLLLSSRGGWIEAVNPDTLETISRVKTPRLTESMASSFDGSHLFVAAPKDGSKSCCTIYSLDPLSMQLSPLIEPAQAVTVASNRVLVQRGNTGVDSFDSSTLLRLPVIKAPGVYRFSPSADGRRAFGITNFPQPSLGLFDLVQGALVARHALPGDGSAAGAWIGETFFLFLGNGQQGTLQAVSREGELGPRMPLSFRISGRACPYSALAIGGKLILYSGFGYNSDQVCDAPGGFVAVNPSDGAATPQLDGELQLAQLVTIPGGDSLYGLEVGFPSWRHVRMVKLDPRTGEIMRERELDANVWSLTAGRLPDAMVGRLDLIAAVPVR